MPRYSRRAVGGLFLSLAVLSPPAIALPAAPVPPWHPGPQVRIKAERIRVDVHADFSYTETVERRIEILSPQAGRPIGAVAVGLPDVMAYNLARSPGAIELLHAYTLKTNGQQIPAVPASAFEVRMMSGTGPGVRPDWTPLQDVKWTHFPQLEAGDVLVESYRGSYPGGYKGAPNVLVLDEVFSSQAPIDDGEITVTAPTSMRLTFRLTGMPPANNTGVGGHQRWTWRYHSPDVSAPTYDVVAARVHISTFPSDAAEADFFARRAVAQRKASGTPACPRGIGGGEGLYGWRDVLGTLGRTYGNKPAALQAMIDALNSPGCVFPDGRPKLSPLTRAFDSSFADDGVGDSYAYLMDVKKNLPGTPFVPIAEAAYWIDKAGIEHDPVPNSFPVRRPVQVRDKPAPDPALVRQRLEKAERVLAQSRSYASSIPAWYELMIQVEALLDRPEDRQTALFEEGRRRYPGYYPLYFTRVRYLTPAHGGSWATVDDFVKRMTELTRASEGEVVYARLYWYVYRDLRPGERLFADTRASWPRMKRGFEDLMARYPRSRWNRENFARFACMAGDRKTLEALHGRPGKDYMPLLEAPDELSQCAEPDSE